MLYNLTWYQRNSIFSPKFFLGSTFFGWRFFCCLPGQPSSGFSARRAIDHCSFKQKFNNFDNQLFLSNPFEIWRL
ncbi:hypothetical protein LguiA_022818 [Lonicera macranthoides]